MSGIESPELLSAVKSITVTEADGSQWFDVATSPDTVETIAQAIADRASTLSPTVVITWNDVDEVVLGHAVAARLGVARSSIDVDIGLLRVTSLLVPESHALLLATAFTANRASASMRALLEGQGHTVVGIASFAGDGETGVSVRGFIR